MGRIKPCEACRRRKGRCEKIPEGCKYCAHHKKVCSLSPAPVVSPAKIDVVEGVKTEHTQVPEDAIPPESSSPFISSDYDSAMLAGPSGEQDPVLMQYYRKDKDGVKRFLNHAIREMGVSSTPIEFTLFSKPAKTYLSNLLKMKSTVIIDKVNPFSERLLALYFKFIDWTYPAVDKVGFYRKYYYADKKLHIGIYAGMLALSTIYWKYDSALCVQKMPPKLAGELWELVQIIIDDEMTAPTLETIQCQLLHLQRRLPRDDPSELAKLSSDVAKLVSCAYTLGLHINSSHWNLHDRELMLRKRLWALVYVNDKWIAGLLGRPPLLNSVNTTTPSFDTKFPEEVLFKKLTELTEILDPILSEFYGARMRYSDFDPTDPVVWSKVGHYLNCLQQWWAHLPPELNSMEPTGSDYCRNGTIFLCSLTIECLLLRVLLHPRNMNTSIYPSARQKAQDLIQRIMTFTGQITHSHLHAFWLSYSSLAFSMLAHFVFFYYVQSTDQEKEESRPSIRMWLWALRVLSNAWHEGTGFATMRMDAIFHMGQTDVVIPTTPHQKQPSEQRQERQNSEPSVSTPSSMISNMSNHLSEGDQDRSFSEGAQALREHRSPHNGNDRVSGMVDHDHADAKSRHKGPKRVNSALFDEFGIGVSGKLLNKDIMPLNEQQHVYTTKEYYEGPYDDLYEHLTLDDLVHDNLHDLLARSLQEDIDEFIFERAGHSHSQTELLHPGMQQPAHQMSTGNTTVNGTNATGAASLHPGIQHISTPNINSPRLHSPHLHSPHLHSPHLQSPHGLSPHGLSPHGHSPHELDAHEESIMNGSQHQGR